MVHSRVTFLFLALLGELQDLLRLLSRVTLVEVTERSARVFHELGGRIAFL